MNIALPILLLALLSSISCALDADAIKGLAKKPHDRSEIMEELKIYPEARKYKISLIYAESDGTKHEAETTAGEKVVEGKYLVSWYVIPGTEGETTMVVSYDRKAKVYRKWVLTPGGDINILIGSSIKGSRTISWRQMVDLPGPEPLLSIERHSPMQSTFKEIYYEDGEEVFRVDGTAKVTKQK